MLGFLLLLALGLVLIGTAWAIGPTYSADGSTPPGAPRYGKTGEQVVGQVHGKYYEAAHRGVLFAACDAGGGLTLVTSVATTATAVLYNPQGSGKRLAIKKVSIGYISGTLGAGTVYHCVNNSTTQTAPSSGTALTPVCSDIGNGASPVGQARMGATVVAPVPYRPFCSSFVELATTANPLQMITEDVDGEIVLEPGTSYQIQAVLGAGGSTPKVTVGIVWEEVPIV